MQKTHQWEIAAQAAWGVALSRESVIRPLAEHPTLSSEGVPEAADQLGLSRSVLYKLLQRYGGGLRPLPYFPGSAVASRMSPSRVMNVKLCSTNALMSSISDLSVHPSRLCIWKCVGALRDGV
jgi:hypothetical protein